MNSPRVLVGCPSSDKKHYCKDEWIQSVKSLSYPNYDVLVVDNSYDAEYHKKEFIDKGINCIHIEPKGSPIEYIKDSQNVLLQEFIKGGYDYLFMLESDVFPPSNIIEYLMHFQVPVVTYPYAINYRECPSVCWQTIEDTYAQRQTLLIDDVLASAKWEGGLQQVFACGIGCTLIMREVFTYVSEFRAEALGNENLKDPTVFSDTYFYRDLHRQGIPAYMVQEGLAEHKWSDWSKNEELINIK